MKRFRGALRTLHRVVGIGVGLLLLLQACTGLLWVNQEGLERLMHPPTHAATPGLPLDGVLQALSVSKPGAMIDRIVYPRSPHDALTARLVDRQGRMAIAFIDPGDGRILSSGPLAAYPEQLAERMHATLMLGPAGHWIVLGEGLALVTLAISGLGQWWPGVRRLKAALAVSLKGPPLRQLRQAHAAPGALAAAAFLIVGVSGAMLAAEAQVALLVRWVAPSRPDVDPPSPPPGAPAIISAQRALDLLQARFPHQSLNKVLVPDTSARVIIAVFDHPRLGQPVLLDAGAVDRTNGRLTVLIDSTRNLPGDTVLAWLAPVHSARLFGPLRSLLASAAALALCAMVFTGLTGWVLARRLRIGR